MHQFWQIAFVLLFSIFATFQVKAHDPDQFTYNFITNNKQSVLRIHLTPKSAIDLLITQQPDYEREAVISLSDHYAVFTDYFNKTIKLCLDQQPVELKFLAADLTRHDAYFELELVGFNENFDHFDLKLSSFTDIYRRATNYVKIKQQRYVLNNAATKLLLTNNLAQEITPITVDLPPTSNPINFGTYLGISGLALTLFGLILFGQKSDFK